MSGLQTEFPFTLPKGYVDDDGTLHKTGIMRLACARDEIEPLRDGRVKENEAYATVNWCPGLGTVLANRCPNTLGGSNHG